jgi:hypothetical protein
MPLEWSPFRNAKHKFRDLRPAHTVLRYRTGTVGVTAVTGALMFHPNAAWALLIHIARGGHV